MEKGNISNNEEGKLQNIDSGGQEGTIETDLQQKNGKPSQNGQEKNHNEKGHFVKGNNIGNRYKKGEKKSKESVEKMRKSLKEAWTLKNFHQKMFETLTEIKLEGGGTENFWKIAGQTIHKAILTKEVPMDKKFERIMKTIQTVIPQNKNLDLNTTQPIVIKITKDEQDL